METIRPPRITTKSIFTRRPCCSESSRDGSSITSLYSLRRSSCARSWKFSLLGSLRLHLTTTRRRRWKTAVRKRCQSRGKDSDDVEMSPCFPVFSMFAIGMEKMMPLLSIVSLLPAGRLEQLLMLHGCRGALVAFYGRVNTHFCYCCYTLSVFRKKK